MKSTFIFYIAACVNLFCWTSCVSDPDLPSDIINAKVPEVKTLQIDGQTATTITLSAEVLKENGMPVTDYGVYWSKTTPIDTLQAEHISAGGKGKGVFTITIEGLDSKTEYYIAPYAKNKKGIGLAEPEKVITEHGLGTVNTLEPQNLTATTVDLGGEIIGKGEGTILERGVYLSIKPKAEKPDTIILSEMDRDSFICHVTKLDPNTIYYVKAFVKNNFGIFTGDEKTFTTTSGLPVVAGLTKVEIGFYDATFKAEVKEEGDSPVTERGLCWKSADDVLPTVEHYTIISGKGAGVFEVKMENLTNDTRYHVRAYAKNEFGVAYSKDTIFSVKSNYPLLDNNLIIEIGKGVVEITAEVLDEGESAVVESGICWSTVNTTPDLAENVQPLSSGKTRFTGLLENLQGNTDYYVWAYAKNSAKTAYSKTVTTFKTPPVYTSLTALNEDIIQGTTEFFYTNEAGFLLGGKKGATYSHELWRYDLTQGKWVQRSPYPETTIIHGQTPVVVNKKVFVFGGRNETIPNSYVYNNYLYEYDTYEDVWRKIDPPQGSPDPVAFSAGFNIGQSAYYAGGIRNNQVIDELNQYITGEDWKNEQRTLPQAQFGGVALVLNDEIFAGLGILDIERTNNNKRWWSSSDYGNSWNERAPIPQNASRIIGGVVYQEDIYVIDNNGQIWQYSTVEDKWHEKTRLSELNNEIHCIYLLDDKIYIGLGSGTGKFVAYSPYWDN